MRSPLEDGEWQCVESTPSTQELAAATVRLGRGGVFLAFEQTHGRGRLGRSWHSIGGESLTMSMAFPAYADHPRPFLVGMTVAVAAAAVLHAEIAWPNDLMAGGRKLGGILTELVPDEAGRATPVVGLGINLNQREFPPELDQMATSATLVHGRGYDPVEVGRAIVARLSGLPEPSDWGALAPVWSLFDRTPGKRYRLPDGREALALGIGPDGSLMSAVDGETVAVMAAEATFGALAGAS